MGSKKKNWDRHKMDCLLKKITIVGKLAISQILKRNVNLKF